MSSGSSNLSGFTNSVQIWMEAGLRVPSDSTICFIVRPVSTMSSTITTSRPDRFSLIPNTSCTLPVEVMPWYEASFTNEISQGIVISRIRSAAKMNDPFSTPSNRGFLPSKSLLIRAANSFTRCLISASGIEV
jgi:hypothetical protein